MTTTDDDPARDATRSASVSHHVRAPPGSGTDEATGPRSPRLADTDAHADGAVEQRLLSQRAGPAKLGRFVVLDRIGRGAMGLVFACYDDRLDRKVAVKILRADTCRDPTHARARLLREAQAMARLAHPNIVTVHEVGFMDDQVFVAMEVVHGVSLDVWRGQAPRSWQEVLAAYLQAGRGLAAAHRGGIVHRDFKPQNVMINADGLVKVLDFGLARASDGDLGESLQSTDDGASSGSPQLGSLTRTGALLGTPAYMSPEQHRGEVATAASDQFSFCVALYQALYDAQPFSVASLAALQRDVMAGRIAPAPARSPVPARVDQALRRGMAADPGQRFASMDELLAALEPDARMPLRRTIALVTAAALVGGASFAAFGSRDAVARCPDAHAELAGSWDPERVAAVQTSLRAALPDADEALPRIEREVTRYAETWVQMRNDACLAHAEGRQSAHLFDLRTSCLDRRRASLRALTETLAAPAPESLAHLVGAASGLPPLEPCADAAWLTAEVAPPEDPALRARVDRHFERLAQADVYYDTSQLRRARALVEDVLADPDVGAYEPVLAQAHLYRGYLQEMDGETAPVHESYTQALSFALSGGHDILAAQASAGRMFFMATKLDRLAQAKDEAWLVDALNRKARHDVDTYARYLHFTAAVHFMDRDAEGALRIMRETVALREQHGRDRTREHLGSMMVLGTYTATLGRHAEAIVHIRRAIERSEEVLGPYYANWYWAERQLAYSTIDLGRPREALARLQQILAARSDRFAGEVARVVYEDCLALAEFTTGDRAAAHRRMDAALRRPPKGVPRFVWTRMMWFAAADGDAAGMQRAAGEALRDLDGIADRQGSEYQYPLLVHGRSLNALGRPGEALVPLTKAMTALADGQSPFDVARRARLSLELGEARRALAELDAAERDLRDALAGFEQALPPENLEIAEALLALGELARVRQRPEASVAWLARAEAIFAASAEQDYPPLVRTRAALAQLRAG